MKRSPFGFKEQLMNQTSPKGNPGKYFRPKADRHAIEKALDETGSRSCRSIAKDVGRSPCAILSEVSTNRVVMRGPGKKEKRTEPPTILA